MFLSTTPKEKTRLDQKIDYKSIATFCTLFHGRHFDFDFVITGKYMHAETLALLTKPFPNMKYLKQLSW
jgi:hypothetical protein